MRPGVGEGGRTETGGHIDLAEPPKFSRKNKDKDGSPPLNQPTSGNAVFPAPGYKFSFYGQPCLNFHRDTERKWITLRYEREALWSWEGIKRRENIYTRASVGIWETFDAMLIRNVVFNKIRRTYDDLCLKSYYQNSTATFTC